MLMAKQRERKLGNVKRALLWLPAKLYELLVRLRIAAYETDYLRAKRLDAFVISVGNLTLGGTGKTPVVRFIARYLAREDRAVAILTRGYGRRSQGRRVLNAAPATAASADGQAAANHGAAAADYQEFGDEPLMLARALPEVPVVIDRDRFAGGSFAREQFHSEVMVLDDGYQHLRLARDLNILLLDATDPFGGFEMAPFGRLREPLYALRRADVVIITRADRPFDQGQTLAIIRHICGDEIPVMYFYATLTGFRLLTTGEVYEAEAFVGWSVLALCGIGNPAAFSEDLMRLGLSVAAEEFFADHHAYTQADLQRVTEAARAVGAEAIVTTEKDAVRLERLQQSDMPIYAAQLEVESEDEVRFKSLLLRALIRHR